jgi:hypothetical protein
VTNVSEAEPAADGNEEDPLSNDDEDSEGESEGTSVGITEKMVRPLKFPGRHEKNVGPNSENEKLSEVIGERDFGDSASKIVLLGKLQTQPGHPNVRNK